MESVARESSPHLQRILIVLYTLGPRRGELLGLEWPDVDMQHREFTLRHTKNGESRTVLMTPEVHRVFTELWQERRLDTHRVFLYKDKPIGMSKPPFTRHVVGRGSLSCGCTISDIRHVRICGELGWTRRPP